MSGSGKDTDHQVSGALLDLKFNRIQFTPDLMPSDILGTEILEEDRATGHRHFRFMQGPVFANLILADEINRTPPKTQFALLGAMQELRVTTCGACRAARSHRFRNGHSEPHRSAGTFLLPKRARPLHVNLKIGYLPEDEEVLVVQNTTSVMTEVLKPILKGERLVEFQGLVRGVPVSDHVARYAVFRLAAATRPVGEKPLDFVKKWVTWGQGNWRQSADNPCRQSVGASARALPRERGGC